ncbi:MAG TPA: hypothetical protein VHG08_25500 [Longimicrobium sp.]|nr:hypothetical protein [Longimicrobium sp.]
MARPAMLECPNCDSVEDPVRHTYQSDCGGVIYRHNGTLQCGECAQRISLFRCDDCRSILGRDAVSPS